MKLLPRMGLVLGLLALLWAGGASGDELSLSVEKKILPGSATITYLGQTLEINTPVALKVRLEPDPVGVRFKFFATSGGFPGANLHIYWVNVGTDVYNGEVFNDPLEGILNTEGGFVDR
jgi:hypothetical protein